MNKNPLISIIIPCYNSELTIQKCIISACNQTYQNLEILIIDDGSKDKTSDIVRKFQENDPRINYIYKNNSGVSNTRNLGIKKSKGEFLLFLDSDDYLMPTMIEKLFEAQQKYSVSLVICGYKTVTNIKQQTNSIPMELCYKTMTIDIAFEDLFWNWQLGQPWNKLFSKKDINYYFNEDKQNGEDLEFVLQYLKNKKTLVCIPDDEYCNNVENTESLSRNYIYLLQNIKENHLFLWNYIKECNVKIEKYKLSDFIISQIWSSIRDGTSNEQFSINEGLSLINIDGSYISLIEKLTPKKIINKFMKYLLTHNNLNILKLCIKSMLFIKK